MNSNQSKQKLARSWIKLVATDGVVAATLQKVAIASKVPFPTAHYHFGGGRNRLQEFCLKQIADSARTFTEQEITLQMKLKRPPIEAYIYSTFKWIEHCKEDAQVWLYSYYATTLSTAAKKYQTLTIDLAKERVFRLLCETAGMRTQTFTPTRNLAQTVHSLVLGLGIQAIMAPTKVKRDELQADCLNGVSLLISSKGRSKFGNKT